MRKLLLIACIGTVFFVLDGALTAPSPFEGKIVKKIEFEGLRNIDPDDLLDIMITEEGYPLVSADLSKDVDAIFKKGNFENVRVAASEFQDGVRIRIICKVRPVVKEIVIKGNDEVHRTELAEIILQKEDEPLRIDLVEKSVRAMKEKYDKEGLFNAVITYRVERSEKDEERVNVVFVIDEGEEVKIAKIIIMGARRIPVDEIMGVLELKEDGFFSDGDFKRDEYEKDKGKILALYRERGYLDAQIIEDKVEYEWENPEKQEKRAIFVTIKLSEGDRYFFDRYTIAGNKVIESRVFEQQFEQTKSGAIFNDTLFQKDRQMISYSYSTMGYIFARVIPKRTVEERQIDDDGVMVARKYVRIDFEITEGTQAYIENIIIKGNKKTKDKVIRRELLMKEGELFNAEKMRISREKVYNLGYFKEVNFDVRPGSKEG
ncbi:MAG TPA: POTRA domain-containing protein, partial [Spirochaetota bacterium]|nr:POTRA domain-containing protein [Spirochaetota bacterium]